MRRRDFSILALIAGVGLAGCGGSSSSPSPIPFTAGALTLTDAGSFSDDPTVLTSRIALGGFELENGEVNAGGPRVFAQTYLQKADGSTAVDARQFTLFLHRSSLVVGGSVKFGPSEYATLSYHAGSDWKAVSGGLTFLRVTHDGGAVRAVVRLDAVRIEPFFTNSGAAGAAIVEGTIPLTIGP